MRKIVLPIASILLKCFRMSEGIMCEKLKNDPNLTAHPGGVAATVAVAVRFNEKGYAHLGIAIFGVEINGPSSDSATEKLRKMVLGSRPPGCVNKCMNCRPCEATVVIPPHRKKVFEKLSNRGDDTYYLLAWKCRCGDKLYQP
ncbi:unnamed protein product [Fraxinus pennsylvanica]|uniref:Epidermal patterning factor-like protein n=1 Tax=Fraxinus pennsylvanica TaxID=56036 RepID=A0AAD2A271_9LAMI|nr:unnamed protein product [Fraxinus pennsylvanica]